MYNRYVPQPDGTYRRDRVDDHPGRPPAPPPPPPKPDPPPASPSPDCPLAQPPKQEQKSRHPACPSPPAGDFLRQLLPQNLDTGDLMVIILLLLMAGDCQEDRTTALLTLAIYLLMQ